MPERIEFAQGDLLAARDLQDGSNAESRMRSLHVRAVHATWGVVFGFEVSVSADGRAAIVGPGLAYDCHGRELVSGVALVAVAPGQTETEAPRRFDLVARYATPELLAACEPEAGAGVRLERPELRWLATVEPDGASGDDPPIGLGARLGEDIPLVRFTLSAAGLSEHDVSHRRIARRQPHVAAGHLRGSLALHPSEGAATPLRSLHVDTTSASFNATPLYFAHLVSDAAGYSGPRSERCPAGNVVGPFLSIRDESPTGFTLDIRFGVPVRARSDTARVIVAWVGVEPAEADREDSKRNPGSAHP